jgi:microcystin-dependent protein
MPVHTHSFTATEEVVNENNVTNNFFGAGESRYAPPANVTQMAPQALPPAGGSLPHNNMMPYLVVNFCIALQGVFPPRP